MNLVQKEISDSIIGLKAESKSKLNVKISFTKEFIGFNGHFDEQPVLPAICFFEIIKCSLYKQLNTMPVVCDVLSAKFYNVITVKEIVDISILSQQDFLDKKNRDNEFILNAKFMGAGSKKAIIKIKVRIGQLLFYYVVVTVLENYRLQLQTHEVMDFYTMEGNAPSFPKQHISLNIYKK